MPGGDERVFLFFDEALWPTAALGDRFRRLLDESGAEWCLAAEHRGGLVIRVSGWPSFRGSATGLREDAGAPAGRAGGRSGPCGYD